MLFPPWAGAAASAPPAGEVALRLGNESNGPDGVFGPLTWGLEGHQDLFGGCGIDGTYVRLHEPGTPIRDSVVDEAQLTLRLPERIILGQPVVLAGTVWRNRMIDLYTDLVGLEAARPDLGPVEVTVGGYAGRAYRDEVHGRFIGGQLAISGAIRGVEWSLTHLQAAINDVRPGGGSGFDRKSGVGVARELFETGRWAGRVTLDLEDRHFSFGPAGPAGRARDALIIVLGLELSVGWSSGPSGRGNSETL